MTGPTPLPLREGAKQSKCTGSLERMILRPADVSSAPMHGPRGPCIGALDTSAGRKIMRSSDPVHLLCFAPSRSGKGVGPVITTLLSYPHSTATNDIKGENFELSCGFRHSAGSLVIRFDPTSVDQKSMDGTTPYNIAARWNVLDELRIFTEYDVMDAQNIA